MQFKLKKNVMPLVVFFSLFSGYGHAVCVGQPYEGGTVFCVSQSANLSECVPTGGGRYGLIVANQDQANYLISPKHGVLWSNVSSPTNATSVDDGATNTALIIAAFPKENATYNAAWACHNYRDPDGYTDWYLPSANEINKLSLYATAHNLVGYGCSGNKTGGIQCFVGGLPAGMSFYWSSTECSTTDALGKCFGNGGQLCIDKITRWFGARAIRAFNDSVPYQFPVVANISKYGNENIAVAFSAADFNTTSSNLTRIQPATLPDANCGALMLFGVAVNASQEILTDSLGNLTFVPQPYWYGSANFSYYGGDSCAYSVNPANVNITIAKSNTPTISGLSKNSGGVGNTIAVTIDGYNFATGTTQPTVTLVNGTSTIDSVAITGVTSNQITCNIDLTNVPLSKVGSWNVVVTNPGGQSATLLKGFLIVSNVTPVISQVTTVTTGNTVKITLSGSDFVSGVDGVTVQLVNGSNIINVTVVEVTATQVICTVDLIANPEVLVGNWNVVLGNADKQSIMVESVRIAAEESSAASTTTSVKSWLIPTVVVPVVAVACAVASSCAVYILHKRGLLCHKKPSDGVELPPIYSTGGSIESGVPVYSTSSVGEVGSVTLLD